MTRFRLTCGGALIVGICLCLPGRSIAQENPNTAPVARALRSSGLRGGTLLRIETADSTRYGYFRGLRGDSLIVEDGAMNFGAMPLARVTAIDARTFRPGRSTLIGALAGVAVGMSGAAIAAARAGDYGVHPMWAALVIGLPVGLASGTVLGVMAGYLRRTWVGIYP